MSQVEAQTKKLSILEAIVNVTSGMLIAFSFTQFVAVPVLGIDINYEQNFWLTLMLTFVSIVRGYLWRRFFNSMYKKELNLKQEERDVRD